MQVFSADKTSKKNVSVVLLFRFRKLAIMRHARNACPGVFRIFVWHTISPGLRSLTPHLRHYGPGRLDLQTAMRSYPWKAQRAGSEHKAVSWAGRCEEESSPACHEICVVILVHASLRLVTGVCLNEP